MRNVHSAIVVAVGVALGMLNGCATTTESPSPHPSTQVTESTRFQYQPNSAAALAFDPPIAMGQPMPDTSRDGRAQSAFFGYEEQVTTVSSLYQRDEIRGFHGDFDRQAYTGRTSVTTR